MQLIIVESPTKARTLSRFLGNEYSIEATMGHIKDLPKSELGIDIANNFRPEYIFIAKRKEAVDKIKKAARKASQILLATDPDREGEAISSHVKEVLGDGKTSRIVFHEITKEAVAEALTYPRDIDGNLVDAQIARRVLDRLVGYKLSPLLWKKVRRGLSAGRVQTVTVRLIVEKEREIEKFKPQEYWNISCVVKPKGKKDKVFVVYFVGTVEKKIEVDSSTAAREIVSRLEKSDFEVASVTKREVRKNPYPPFTTSTLTQAAARIFGWSAKRTMSIAQRLYERGFITYHRTDSTFVSQTAIKKVRDFILALFGQRYLPHSARYYRVTSKVAQEAHEAIRPTNLATKSEDVKSKKYGRDTQILYDLVWRRFVASQMAGSLSDETKIDVHAKEKETYLLRTSGQVVKFDGWRKVIPAKKDAESEVVLPDVEKGQALSLIEVTSEQKFTEPPARYNEASLIKALEKLGIGRPSTYAPIISTIQIRNYVEKIEGKFQPTPIGVAVNDFLLAHFPDVFDYQFTAEMEDDLDKVADGKVEWEGTIKKFFDPFEKRLTQTEANSKRVKIEVQKLGKKCPKCKKGELVVRIGRFGKFISCSRFPDCDYTDKYIEKVGMKCPKCVQKGLPAGRQGEVVIKKTSKGKRFYGCSRFPACKWASWRNPKAGAPTQTIEPKAR
ncbi:MAG: type I DNA topoisomerase [Patescibacteria group bacterium]